MPTTASGETNGERGVGRGNDPAASASGGGSVPFATHGSMASTRRLNCSKMFVFRRAPARCRQARFLKRREDHCGESSSPPITAPFRSKLCVPLRRLYQRKGNAHYGGDRGRLCDWLGYAASADLLTRHRRNIDLKRLEPSWTQIIRCHDQTRSDAD
jgi:hypothetical protein